MSEEMLKRTPLYEKHLAAGGKMVPFGGWELPVQYPAGVIAEHMAVRNACGLFDVSHMGEIALSGPDALQNLNHLLTNRMDGMEDNDARYSPMCFENGGTVDDLIVYRQDETHYLLVVNAANKDKDFAWMQEHQMGDVIITDVSEQYAQLALQGPASRKVLEKLAKAEELPERYYTVRWNVQVAGVPCLAAATGYTGEDGIELYMSPEKAAFLWDALLEAGKEEGLLPCGLGARDTLRLEAGMPLYGHELSESITPLEAGLSHFVCLDKESFIGKEALLAANPPARRRVGLVAKERGILREHMEVYRNGQQIGVTTSGTKCPYVNQAVAFALVESSTREPGAEVEVNVRGKLVRAEMTSPVFYKRNQK